MKALLSLACVISLLSTTGCIVADDRRGHDHYEHRDAVIVAPPPVQVVPPEVIVR